MAAAGGGGGAGPGRALQAAMRAASGALEMDSGGRPGEAYVEYLKSIALISQALQDEALTAGGEGLGPDTPKMLKLAEQCLERVKSLAAALGKGKAKAAPQERGGGPAPVSRHRRVFSDEGGKLSPFLPPEIFQKLQIAEAQAARKELTPLEEASLQNQKLKAAYEARVARLNPSQAVQKTSLTLSLQRQMMENLVIAKAREETLQRKMEERRLRLQEAANRRFSSSVALTPEEQEQRALYAAILEYEQDHDWPRQWKARLKRSPADLSLVTGLFSCLLSFPEHPIAQLLRKLQCAVYTRLYPAVSQSSPEAAPTAPASLSFLSLDCGGVAACRAGGPAAPSLSAACTACSRCPSTAQPSCGTASPARPSPTAAPTPPGLEGDPQAPRESSFEDLERFLASPEDWPLGEPPGQAASLQEQLKGVVRDIHNAIDRLLSLTLLAFEGLNTAAGKDQCLACIEEAFFPQLWAPLLALYSPPLSARRSVHRPREAALARSMERHRNASPAELGLPSRLFPAAPGSSPAYGAAVEDLRLIPLETCPRRKLDCIVRALRSICECAEEYCSARNSRAPSRRHHRCGRPAAPRVVRGVAQRAAPAAPRVRGAGGIHPRGVPAGRGGVLPDLPAERTGLPGDPALSRPPRTPRDPPGKWRGSARGGALRGGQRPPPTRGVTDVRGPGGAAGVPAEPGAGPCGRLPRPLVHREAAAAAAGGAGAAAGPAGRRRSPPGPGAAGPPRAGAGAAGPGRPPSSCWSGRPSTSTSSPGARSSAPCRPSRGPTCTRCGRRCPKLISCGVLGAWATHDGTSTAWPCAAGPRALSWPLPPAASSPAGWSVRSWPRCCSGCGPAGCVPRSC
nr:VPS9 domain-containing protein 1 isoform X5 [Anas platyrhynchos]